MKKLITLALIVSLFSVSFANRAQALTCDDVETIGALFNVSVDKMIALYGLVSGGCGGGIDPVPPNCFDFSEDFGIGSLSSDINNLGMLLVREGFSLQGSHGGFDDVFYKAVVKFQAKYGIKQTGYVGPITRAKLNSLYGCKNTSSNITVTSPNGGEQWMPNSVQDIKWNSLNADIGSKVDLYLEHPYAAGCANCGALSTPITLDKNIDNTTGANVYRWIVATDIVNNRIQPGWYHIRVCPAITTGVFGSVYRTDCDSSDKPFQIVSVTTF